MAQTADATLFDATVHRVEKIYEALAGGEGHVCEEGCPFFRDEGVNYELVVNFVMITGHYLVARKKYLWRPGMVAQRIGGLLRGVGSGTVASVGRRGRR